MNLDELREKIDAVDAAIVEGLAERYRLVRAVGEWKRQHGVPVYIPEREQQLLKKLLEKSAGAIPPESLLAVYREIIAGARKLEKELAVACLGPEGTFSDQAARIRFGQGTRYLLLNTIADVFREVESGRADYGCVPVENSTEGVVNPTLDALRESGVCIIGELYLAIHHQLLSMSPLGEISCVYSHPQALAQCRRFLAGALPGISPIEVASTMRAAELAAREPGSAALAPPGAAERFALQIVAENVEDRAGNTTRFLIIGRQQAERTGDDKTSICFILKHQAGALCEALLPLSRAGISMSMIESRPLADREWEYGFFADLLGHRDDPAITAVLADLEASCISLKILGSYPRADL